LNLKLYIKQTDTFKATGGQIHYDGASPATLKLYSGPLPNARRWPNYGSYVDVTNSTGNLYKLKLTWTAERDNSGFVTPGALQQKKSASGTLTFEGEAYQLLKKWLIDDVSAPLNCVDVKIDHEGCGEYLDYSIKSTDIRWCENSICTFDVTLKQKDEALNCIKSTLIADNWQHWFEEGAGIAKKHPRFSYCNEQRPNGMMVMLWWNMAILGMITSLLFVSLLPVIWVIMTIIWVIVKVINGIISFLNALGAKLKFIDFDPTYPTIADVLDIFQQMFIESAGCGREHPAPLVRDYIKNVCDKCGIAVDAITAPIFFAGQITIETSERGVITTDNPHYNACYLTPTVKRGIRRTESLNLFAPHGINTTDYYIPDNMPLHTLDTFLDELKALYNAEWRIKSINVNGQQVPHLYFQRKDYYLDASGSYVFDFTTNSLDRLKLLEGICFEWNERKTYAYSTGVYDTDAADTCGNEAKAFMNGYVSFGNTDENPTFEGKMDKNTAYGATRFRLDGITMDYVYDAMQVVVNGSFLTPFLAGIFFDFVAPKIEEYGDYALLLKDETCTLPKILIWDGERYENARAIKKYAGHPIHHYAMPGINSKYNNTPWHVRHPQDTKVRGQGLTIPPFYPGYYTVTDFFGAREVKQPALLVNYPMYFEPGYYDTLWDWFHWIDDPKLKPVLNQNWTAKIDLCCEDLKKLEVFNDAAGINLGEKIKLPLQYYPDGTITEIEVSYDPTDTHGQFIQLKGTV